MPIRSCFYSAALAAFFMLLRTDPASPASLGIVNPDYSTIDKVIHLVGASGGVLSTTVGDYVVTVRDYSYTPLQGSSLLLDFSQCKTSDTRISSGQLEAGVITDCSAKTLRAVTGPSGTFTFRVMGNSQNLGGVTGLAFPCLRVFADGVLLDPRVTSGPFIGVKAVIVAPYDETGTGGFAGGDLSAFVGDLFHVPATYFARSDFDGNGSISALDLSNQVGAFFAGSWNTTAAVCP